MHFTLMERINAFVRTVRTDRTKDYINIKHIYEKSTATFLLLPNYKWQLRGNGMLKASKIPLLNSRSLVLLNHSVKSHSHEDVHFHAESSFGFNSE